MSPLLVVHIGAGSLGMLSGAGALMLRKGAAPHRVVGSVFLGAMALMAVLGSWLAVAHHSRISAVAGVFTLYLVGSAWMTVRRPARQLGRFELVAMAVVLGCAAADGWFGVLALRSAKGSLQGFPAAAYLMFAVVALLAAGLDGSVLWRGGVAGAQRLARHLWRMCAALYIAVSSFFLGQEQVFPARLQNTQWLMLPVYAVWGAMLYWLARVAWDGWRAARPVAAGFAVGGRRGAR